MKKLDLSANCCITCRHTAPEIDSDGGRLNTFLEKLCGCFVKMCPFFMDFEFFIKNEENCCCFLNKILGFLTKAESCGNHKNRTIKR